MAEAPYTAMFGNSTLGSSLMLECPHQSLRDLSDTETVSNKGSWSQ